MMPEQNEWRYPLWRSAGQAASDPMSPAAQALIDAWREAADARPDTAQDDAEMRAAGWFDGENLLKSLSETGGAPPLAGTARERLLRITTTPGTTEALEKAVAVALEQLSQAAIEQSARLMEQALLRPTAKEMRGAQINITPAPEAEGNLHRWLYSGGQTGSIGGGASSLGQDTLGLYRQESTSAVPAATQAGSAKLTVDELLVYECAVCGRHTTRALCILLPKPLREAGHAICHTCLERHLQPAIDLGRQVRAQSYSRIYVTGGENWGAAGAEKPSRAVPFAEDERPDGNAPGNYEDGL